MKDAYYFSHDSNARNDQRLMKLRMKYGPEGYGIYFMIIEILRDTEDYKLHISDVKSICFDIRDDEEKVLDVLKNYSLFEFEGDYFYSKSLTRRMDKLDRIKEKRRESGKMGAIATAKVRQVLESETASDVASAEQVKHSKAKQSKVENSKEKKSKQVKEPISLSFDLFWNLYDYKQSRPDCEAIWNAEKKNKRGLLLDNDIRQKIIDHLPAYVENTHKGNGFPPRVYPKTYLNNNGWEDEVVITEVAESQEDWKLDGTGKFYVGYCEKCLVSDFYKAEDRSGESRCCGVRILAKRPKKEVENGRSQNLVSQSKRYRGFMEGKNNKRTGPAQIGSFIEQAIEESESISKEESDGQ